MGVNMNFPEKFGEIVDQYAEEGTIVDRNGTRSTTYGEKPQA